MKVELTDAQIERRRALGRAKYRRLAQDPEFRRKNVERVKAWYAKNRERGCERARVWRLENPERDRINHRNWIKRNRLKKIEHGKKWRRLNPEYCHAYSRLWRQKNPEAFVARCMRRRSWKLGVPTIWGRALWRNAIRAFSGKCAYCQQESKKLHQDHFIPICSPFCPGTVPWNMVPACPKCNWDKNSKMPMEWMKDRARFVAISDWLESQKPTKR